MSYYLMSGTDTTPGASAFAPEGTQLPRVLIPIIDDAIEMPFEFSLVKISMGKNGIVISSKLSGIPEIWIDYLPNNLAWPLFSEKLKKLIDENLSGEEGIDWIKAKVNNGNEQNNYYILRFNKLLDVLDIQKTLYVQGTDIIIRPCFSLEKIQKLSVFYKPTQYPLWKITPGLYVCEKIKKSIQKEKLTGIGFGKTMTC